MRRIRNDYRTMKLRAAARVRDRLRRLEASEWLATAYVLGGVFGLLTLLRIRPDAPSFFALTPTSDTYLESLIGLLITFVGFVIIAVVFVYEQQRRAWRIAFRIRDEDRRVIVRGAGLSVGLVVVSIWSGLVGLSQDASGELLLERTWPTLVAAVSGFAGTAGSVATLVMGVRLLSSRRLAARILSAPDRISSRDESEEPLRPSDHLMELALAEHRAEDDEEFRSRIGSLRRYGAAAGDRTDAQDSVRALIDVAMLVLGRRDRARSAVQAAQHVMGNTVLGSPEPDTPGRALGPEKQAIVRERDALLRKTLTLLDRNLAHDQPSGSLLREILELGRLIHPEPRRRQELFNRAVGGTLFRGSPTDLWENVALTLIPRGTAHDHRAERALVIALTAATDPSSPGLASGGTAARLAATRALELLPHLDLAPDGLPDGLDHASVQRLHVQLLLCLQSPDRPDRAIPTGDAAVLVRELASRARYVRTYDWADPLPAGYRSCAIMLSEVLKVVEDPRLGSSIETTGLRNNSVRNQAMSAGRSLFPDPEMTAEVVEFVLAQLEDIVAKRRAAAVIRLMLWANEPLRGVAALGSFVLLNEMARVLNRSAHDGSPLAELGNLDLYFKPPSRPATGFFSPGLVDCSKRARELLLTALSVMQGFAPPTASGPLEVDEEQPLSAPTDDREQAEVSPLVVFGRFALVLATALAVHLDGQDGITVFAAATETVGDLPTESPAGMSAATIGQLLVDALALATLVLDLVERRTAAGDAGSEGRDDATGDAGPGHGRFDFGRTLEAVTGLDLLRRLCEMDVPYDGEEHGDLEATLRELKDANRVLEDALAPSAGEAIVDQLTTNRPQTRAWIPWTMFPDWAWESAAATLAGRDDVRMPDRATLLMVAAVTDERPAVWQRRSGFRPLVECLVEHEQLSDFAQGMLIAMLADVEASQASIESARALLDRARQMTHVQIELRRMFIAYATSDDRPQGDGMHFAARLAREHDPRKAFAAAEIGLRWMRSANRRLTLADCTRKLARISPDLSAVALAEQALRGQTLDVRRILRVGTRSLERLATTCRRDIERLNPDAPSSELIPGLDPTPHVARLVGLHVVQIATAAQLRSEEELDRAREAVDVAAALLEDVTGSLGGQLRRSFEAARALL